MRDIKYLVVHCSGGWQTATVEAILNYHKVHNKWTRPGYHYIIRPDGVVVNTHTEDEPSNGVKDYNSVSVNVCYIGGLGVDAEEYIDNRTDAQKKALRELLIKLKGKYPSAVIQGHRDFPNVHKACPCFDAKKEYSDI